MRKLNPYIIATKLEKIISNLQPYEAIKIRLLKNFSLTICKIKNSKGTFFNLIGEITHPCDKEYSDRLMEFTAYEISFSPMFQQIAFINRYETHYTEMLYDVNFIKIEDFSFCREERAEMIEFIERFNLMCERR